MSILLLHRAASFALPPATPHYIGYCKLQPIDAILLLHRCAAKKYPVALPTVSVVLIYLDEALSIIQRAVRSIIDRTPAELLAEIILVDDHSNNGGQHSSPFC